MLIIFYILVLLIPLNQQQNLFFFSAYTWSSILVLMTIGIIIYSVLVGKVLLKAAKYSETQSFGADDMRVTRRLLIINTIIALYFIYSSQQ